MQTDIIKNTLEEMEGGARIAPPGKIINNNAFRPISFTYDASKGSFTIEAKNITGVDVEKGAADVAPYILTENSVQFPDPNRERSAVKKDGVLEVTV